MEKINEKSDFSATGQGNSEIFQEKSDNLSSNTQNLGDEGNFGASTLENQGGNKDFGKNIENVTNFPQKTAAGVDNSSNSAENIPSGSEKAEKVGKNQENQGNLSPQELLFTKSSVESFKASFPMLDAEKVRENKDFQGFISILTPNLTLSEVYSRFSALVSSIEEKAQKKLAQAIANANSSVGSLSSSESIGDVFFTKEQVLKMTPAQIRKNYKKIRESQQRW